MEVEFEYDKKVDYLSINIEDKKYKPIERISNFGWISERTAEDLDWAQRQSVKKLIVLISNKYSQIV
jgi:hypothetical protein